MDIIVLFLFILNPVVADLHYSKEFNFVFKAVHKLLVLTLFLLGSLFLLESVFLPLTFFELHTKLVYWNL